MKPPILFLEQQSWRAGAQRVLEEVLRALRSDFSPLVAFPEEGPFAADLRGQGFETMLFPLRRYHSGRKSLAEMAAFPYRSIHCAWLLARTIRQRGVKLIYINGPRCLWAGALAGRLTGVPTLFHLHLTMTRRIDRLVGLIGARQVTRVIACSKSAAAGLPQGNSAVARKLEIIYNPVRSWPAAPALSYPEHVVKNGVDDLQKEKRRPVIGVVGRITPAKGQHVVVEAIGRLVSQGLNPLAIFVGGTDPHDGEDEAYLRSLRLRAQSLGVERNLWWAGYQENPGPFYKAFDILVIPSIGPEGMPMAALEAMQCGVPVIGSDTRGIAEVVHDGHNGFLVPAGDESFLADRLQQVLRNPQLRSHLRTGALNTVDNRFSAAGFGAAIRRVVAELSGPAPATLQARPVAVDSRAAPAGTKIGARP